jgi:hypothetical protein
MTGCRPVGSGTEFMTHHRIAAACAALALCAGISAVATATACAPTEAQSWPIASQDPPASKEEPKRGTDELDRAFVDLDKAYQASKHDAARELDERRKAGDKIDASAQKSVASEYWPRFQALADKGSGRARLWMALEMQVAFPARDRAMNQKESLKLLDDVATKFADEPWIGDLAKSLTALYITLPEEEVDRIVDVLAEKCHRKDVVAEALYRSASYDKSSKRAGAAARADDLSKRLQKDYADTEYGKKVRGEETRAVGLKIGNVAPDFTTTDADGVSFKLSDYRGKVVVLDFWGFW